MPTQYQSSKPTQYPQAASSKYQSAIPQHIFQRSNISQRNICIIYQSSTHPVYQTQRTKYWDLSSRSTNLCEGELYFIINFFSYTANTIQSMPPELLREQRSWAKCDVESGYCCSKACKLRSQPSVAGRSLSALHALPTPTQPSTQ